MLTLEKVLLLTRSQNVEKVAQTIVTTLMENVSLCRQQNLTLGMDQPAVMPLTFPTVLVCASRSIGLAELQLNGELKQNDPTLVCSVNFCVTSTTSPLTEETP